MQTMSMRSEMGQFNPHIRALVGLNVESEILGVTRMNGVTSVITSPTGGSISGQATLINTAGWTWEDLAVQRNAGIVINLPGGGGGAVVAAVVVDAVVAAVPRRRCRGADVVHAGVAGLQHQAHRGRSEAGSRLRVNAPAVQEGSPGDHAREHRGSRSKRRSSSASCMAFAS